MAKKDSNADKEKKAEKDTDKKAEQDAEKRGVTLEDLHENLEARKLIPYGQLPNIDLYMDQVITLMAQQTEGENRRPALTSSMINNYTKQGVLPRTQGKRYTRDHLVDLTMLLYLKEVLPILDIGELLKLLEAEGDPQWRYGKMSEILDREKAAIMELLPQNAEDTQELALQTLSLGLISYITRQTALDLLDLAKDKVKTKVDEQSKGKAEVEVEESQPE
ncbi:MAG TPA: DUF1836 domain-containing protein [Clostridiaceae bacterium]|nr:DUF1836 domain-containing protein [Clostridiaceae bacterium]